MRNRQNNFIKAFLLLINISMFSISYCQTSILEGLSADYSSSGVILSWTIQSGNTCNGIEIYRSSDSINFTKIGQIDGVCGSTTEDVDYVYVDSSPFPNASNYYRIDLGGFGFSEIVQTFYYKISSDGYLLFPNPSNESNKLVFQNPANRKVNLQVFDIFGSLIHSAETNKNIFSIPSSDFPIGMYYFKLIDEDKTKVINGKFEVGR